MESSIWSTAGAVFLLFLSIAGEEVHHVSRSAIAIALMVYIMGNALLNKE